MSISMMFDAHGWLAAERCRLRGRRAGHDAAEKRKRVGVVNHHGNELADERSAPSNTTIRSQLVRPVN